MEGTDFDSTLTSAPTAGDPLQVLETFARCALDRPAPQRGWLAPAAVRLEGDRLSWGGKCRPPRHFRLSSGKEFRRVRPAAGLLEGFLRLADATAEEVRSFAGRWGVLWVCRRHGLPASHNPRPRGSAWPGRSWCRHLGARPDGSGWEPVSVWIALAKEARAMLRLAAALFTRGGPRETEDWEVLRAALDKRGGAPLALPRNSSQRSAGLERAALSQALQGWLDMADLRPAFAWRPSGPELHLSGGGLFAALTLQVVLAACKSEGFATCSACGSLYCPKRRPASGRRRFCERCGLKAAWRMGARDSRARKGRRRKRSAKRAVT